MFAQRGIFANRFVAVSLCAAPLAAIGAFSSIDSGENHAAATTSLADSGVRQEVVALGRLETKDRIYEIGAETGARIGEILVRAGDRVAAGAPLARLESHDELAALLRHAECHLRDAESQLKAEIAYHQKLIHCDDIKHQKNSEDAPLEQLSHELLVKITDKEMEDAQRNLNRLETLKTQRAVSQQEYDDHRLKFDLQQLKLEREKLLLRQTLVRQKLEILWTEANLGTAKESLGRATAAIHLETLRRQVEVGKAKLARTVVTAPVAGSILRVYAWPGEKIGVDPILKMGQTDEMEAVAEVYETDVLKVRVGDRAEVTAYAFDKPLLGKVVRVGTLVERQGVFDSDPTAATDSRVVEVRVRLDNAEPANRFINMQVTVRILVDDRERRDGA